MNMSTTARIKAAGNKMSAFVKLKGGNFSRVDQDVSKSTSILEEKEEFDGYGDAADATVATYEAVAGSIEKFESGDPAQITIGVLDILAEVSQFAALAGPTGAIVAAVVGPLCSIISSLLGAGTGEQVESEEEMLNRVVTEALAVANFDRLQAESKGVTEELSDRIRYVRNYLDAGELGSGDLEVVRGYDMFAGNGFLSELAYYIKKDTSTDDDKVAGRTAQLITSYVTIAYVRLQYLYMLSTLIGQDESAKVTAKNAMEEGKDQVSDAKNLLRSFLGRPNSTNHVVFSKVYLEPPTTFELMEGLFDMKKEGRLMAIYNTKQKKYLDVSKSSDDRSEATTKEYTLFHRMHNQKKFVVFFGIIIESRDKVEIFSLDHAGYVFAEDNYKPVDKDRGRVYCSKKGDQVNSGYWQLHNQDPYGKDFIRNRYQNNYIYAADYNASGGINPVYTWRRGNSVNQGYWIFEDLKVRGDVKRICSVSSGNYLHGRHTSHDGIDTIWLTNFDDKYSHYYDWYLIKLSDGTYNIKSKSSNMYLHGRHEGIEPGPCVGLFHLSDEKASNFGNVKWRITEYFVYGKTRYAIQSVSSRLYLNGRDPQHVGSMMLHLTNRNPQNDKYLMWDLL